MFSVFDPLIDFSCPHCHASLRWRRVSILATSDPAASYSVRACPLCEGKVIERRHPAIANNWLWSRFYLPGVALCAMGTFVPALGWILPFALATLALGLVALVIYMIRERWGWQRYGACEHEEAD